MTVSACCNDVETFVSGSRRRRLALWTLTASLLMANNLHLGMAETPLGVVLMLIVSWMFVHETKVILRKPQSIPTLAEARTEHENTLKAIKQDRRLFALFIALIFVDTFVRRVGRGDVALLVAFSVGWVFVDFVVRPAEFRAARQLF